MWAGLALAAAALVASPASAQDQPAPAQQQQAPVQQPAPVTPAPGTAPLSPRVRSSAKIAPGRIASYDNVWELYGGLSFMNGQAGQNIPVRYNMGGGEVMATYWLGPRLGVAGDYRLEFGTTPLLPNRYYNRVLVYQSIPSGGLQYRGPRGRYAAVDYHALFGVSMGTFDHAIKNYPGGSPVTASQVGLYNNGSTPWGAVGGSIDFNKSAKLAIRISPDLIFEHFGTELREFVSVSGGVMYRFGHK